LPLVFTYDDLDAGYGDEFGMTYHYPSRYRPLIHPGDLFVYCWTGRRADGTSEAPVYIGEGMVDAVTRIGERYRCTITDYQHFEVAVPAKSDKGYLEPEANRRKASSLYFQVQVRHIDRKAFEAICKAGSGVPDQPARARAVRTQAPPPSKNAIPASRSPRRVVDTAYRLGMAEAIKRWPNAIVFRAPLGSGFSIAVQRPTGETHYLAVKGTLEREPLLRVTADEMAFFQSHSASYSVWVFYAIDLEAGTGKLHRYEARSIEKTVARRVATNDARMRGGARVVRGRPNSRST
jgi:hypothetical protein